MQTPDEPKPRIAEALQARFSLDGRIAVVTSAGGSASLEIGTLLAAAGAHVVVADQLPNAQELTGSIAAKGGKATAIDTRIEDETSVVSLFHAVKEKFGRTDILVNCAGLLVNQEFTQLTLDEWDRAYSLNVRAAFLCMREAVKSMLETGGGRIVNVTTIGARHPVLHGNAAYSSSRAALNMLARNVALDYAAHGILCNTVMPGSIPGKIRIDEATLQSMQSGRAPSGPILGDAKRLPMGNGSAEDIAAAVLYLVGPSGSYITGQELVVDGGFLLT